MNRYGLTDRELHRLWNECGTRACSTMEHHRCPYGNEGVLDCLDRLEKDHEDMVLRLLEGEAEPMPETHGMDAERKSNILQRAVHAYGASAQVDMMLEEMSELAKALLKWRRTTHLPKMDSEALKACIADIREEAADTQIMLNQMCLIFGDFNEQEIAKLERLDRRLKEANA